MNALVRKFDKHNQMAERSVAFYLSCCCPFGDSPWRYGQLVDNANTVDSYLSRSSLDLLTVKVTWKWGVSNGLRLSLASLARGRGGFGFGGLASTLPFWVLA